jgi:hypothetical protein
VGLPVHHLDDAFWRAGWVPVSDAEWTEAIRTLIARQQWIIDGNYIKPDGVSQQWDELFELRVARADTIVFLDLPTRVCLYRLIARHSQQWFGRGESLLPARIRAGPGGPRLRLIPWEILKTAFAFRRMIRPRILRALRESGGHAQVVILSRLADVRQWSRSVIMKPVHADQIANVLLD